MELLLALLSLLSAANGFIGGPPAAPGPRAAAVEAAVVAERFVEAAQRAVQTETPPNALATPVEVPFRSFAIPIPTTPTTDRLIE